MPLGFTRPRIETNRPFPANQRFARGQPATAAQTVDMMTRNMSMCILALLLALASAALAGQVCCTTTEDTLLNRLVTVCSDGTRALSYWNELLQRWDTTVEPAPSARQGCTARVNPLTKAAEVRCR
jgi:hypothetical protein